LGKYPKKAAVSLIIMLLKLGNDFALVFYQSAFFPNRRKGNSNIWYWKFKVFWWGRKSKTDIWEHKTLPFFPQ